MQASAISQMSSLALTKGPGKSRGRTIRQEHFATKKDFYYKTNTNKIRPGLQPHLLEAPRMEEIGGNRGWWTLKEQSRLTSPHQSQLLPLSSKAL